MAFGGRYMLFCMGLFGIYCGTIYNDCMSNPVSLWRSSWTYEGAVFVDATNTTRYLQKTGYVYPYGVDPHWYHTPNQLTFFNSMKMKLAVTLGVSQMSMGIFLSLFNHVYDDDWPGVFF